RFSGDNDFTASSGLSGDNSDWLISGSLVTGDGVDISGRVLLDDDLSITKSGVRVGYSNARFRVSSAYAYLNADPAEDRLVVASELALASEYDFSDTLTGAADFRYDFTTQATTEAGLGLRYTNECVEVALSVSRTFTASSNVSSSTDFGLSVRLRGFGAGNQAGRVRKASCG
ncbi:MAG: LPS-assembly protein LptD, partial [Pseudomonadota bacterium]